MKSIKQIKQRKVKILRTTGDNIYVDYAVYLFEKEGVLTMKKISLE